VTTLAQALHAARGLIVRGPRVVVITSLQHDQAAANQLDTLAVTADAAWVVTTARLERVPNGGGDLLAAILLGQLALGKALPEALALAVSAVHVVLHASQGEPELRLVAGSRQLPSPPPLAVRRLEA
jgi:pyridoxine kinase